MNFSLVFNQIVILFALIAVGFFSKKAAILDGPTTKNLSALVVKITIPALILSAMIKNASLEKGNIFTILSISLVFYFCMFLFALLIPKLLKVPDSSKGVHRFMLMFSNTGFLGLPVIYALWGNEGMFNAIIFNLPYNALAFTIGIYFITNGKNSSFNYRSLITPPIIASFSGLLLFALNLNIPEIVTLTLSNIGSLTTPLALIVIGVSLADVDIKNTFTTHIYYIYCLLKLLLIPLAAFVLLRFIGIEGTSLGVIVLLSGMPIPSNSVILAKQYGANERLASEGVFISTLFSLVTIPFVAYGLSYFI